MKIENEEIRNLFICNTTYQLLVCINIVLDSLLYNQNDIILTDQTDFSAIIKNLRKENLFTNVFEIYPKAFFANKRGISLKFIKFQDVLMPKRIFRARYKLDMKDYDTLYACNMTDPVVMEAYSILAKHNSALKVYEIEDGYGTYIRPLRNSDTDKSKLRWAYYLKKTPYLSIQKITKSLLFFPELYLYSDDVPKEKLQLTILTHPENICILQRIFGCEGYHINKRYIILEEPFKADGRMNNAEELFTSIIDWVGEENVMLKTHPRNGENSYRARKVQVFDLPIAWEALIATDNVDNKILITCTSGTVINTKLLYHSKCKIIFLYKLLIGDASSAFLSSVAQDYLDKFQKKFMDDVYIPETVEELKIVLDQLNI